MSQVHIERSKEPIRLFRSDVLEAFTHVHPAIVPGLWLPIAAFAIARGVQARPAGASLAYLPAAVLVGLALWTLAEYTLHRFLFHFRPRRPWQERVSFLMHGVHHAQPRVKSRLVMPPAVSLPLAAAFYGLFALLLGPVLGAPHWLGPLYGAFLVGYVCYDLTHYATHHMARPLRYVRYVRGHHLRHHGQDPNQRYGVTSTFWDVVFRTIPREAQAAPARARR